MLKSELKHGCVEAEEETISLRWVTRVLLVLSNMADYRLHTLPCA